MKQSSITSPHRINRVYRMSGFIYPFDINYSFNLSKQIKFIHHFIFETIRLNYKFNHQTSNNTSQHHINMCIECRELSIHSI